MVVDDTDDEDTRYTESEQRIANQNAGASNAGKAAAWDARFARVKLLAEQPVAKAVKIVNPAIAKAVIAKAAIAKAAKVLVVKSARPAKAATAKAAIAVTPATPAKHAKPEKWTPEWFDAQSAGREKQAAKRHGKRPD